MARGQVLTLPSGSGTLLTTLTREEKNSLAVLNPNDGYIFIKMNGPAGTNVTQWDWKLPSQSYGLFPGPWQSIGLWYQDQSGSNRSADINIYDNDAKLVIPSIYAVGRAVAMAGSALDISQGTTPANPPASTIRLWADGSGNLHKVDSTGLDEIVIDNTNYLTYITMLGDVIGPLNNTTVHLRFGNWMYMKDTGGADRYFAAYTGDGYVGIHAGTSGFLIANAANTVRIATIDTAGSLSLLGNLTVGNVVTVTGGRVYSSATVGVLVLHAPTVYARNLADSAWVTIACDALNAVTGPVSINDVTLQRWNPGQIRISSAGGLTIAPNGGVNLEASAASIGWGPSGLYFLGNYVSNAINMIQTNAAFACDRLELTNGVAQIWFHPNHSVGLRQDYPTLTIFGWTSVTGPATYNFTSGSSIMWDGTYLRHSHSIAYNTNGNQVSWPNGSYISGNAGYVQGSDKALKIGSQIIIDSKLLDIVKDKRLPITSYRWPEDTTRRNIGFMADHIAQVLPKSVVRNKNGEPSGYSPQEFTAILWGALRELESRVTALGG